LNLQDPLFDTIEDYLNGSMSEQERFAFEERIAQDKSLAHNVAEVRATNEAIYFASLAEMKNTIGQDLKNIKYKPPIDWKKAGIVSLASLAILSGITTYFISADHKKVENTPSEIKQNNGIKETFQDHNAVQSTEKLNTSQAPTHTNNASTNTLPVESAPKQRPTQEDTVVKNSTKAPINTSVETIIPKGVPEPSIKKVEIPATKVQIIPCDKTFKISSDASCKEKETGSIAIISDGATSYTFQLDIQSKTGTKGLFTRLSAGSYDLLVTYNKDCAYTQKVVVGEKWCAMNDPFSFNPDYNEKWRPIYESGASGTITIYDKQGKDIYNLTFGSGNEEWIGITNQGMVAPVGVYVGIINYSDGRKEKVELTIVR
jgi:hypothetical protein